MAKELSRCVNYVSSVGFKGFEHAKQNCKWTENKAYVIDTFGDKLGMRSSWEQIKRGQSRSQRPRSFCTTTEITVQK